MIYFSEKYVEISWDEVNRAVVVIFKGYMSSEQLREAFEKTIECGLKYRAKKCLTDNRNFTTIRPDDQKWLEEVYIPQAARAGFTKIAQILPQNIIQKQVLNKLGTYTKSLIDFHYCESFEEAVAWLKKQ
ncbi:MULTISPECIES: hypothetical protein [Dehalobacter]|jgi:hypothetical protein|uniref:STAS/SEC14 domain-containing protein n=2 Tax=Dehalobacter restrictus TaxID=55583 RepID=A0A857DJ17_9FIRM|nr:MULTISPECIES: hypothetical protein [Dehalobacter]AHF11454.1 hypothetical protein DEHRE_11770 [Dehalobacter restrictus DSM 9455]MCG1026369.1 hypothetical protein [Dehalobacter sp.]MDJ0305507.1 hypothetical protein [Dehalobacter sp.]QHA01284.1 hypothetical protein GQ588_11860 [Dehalobacter restrictus]